MWGGQLLAWGGPVGLQGGGCGVCGMGVGGGGRTGEPRTSTLLICCRMWHCCPSPPALRSLSSIAESSPCATLEQKASGPWMNSLWGRGAGWAQSKARSSMGMKGVRAFLPPQRRELCVTAGGGSKAGCTHRTPLPKAFPRVHPAAARPPPPTHRAPPTPTWSSRSHPAHPPPSGHRPHGAASAPLLPLTPTWVGMDPPPPPPPPGSAPTPRRGALTRAGSPATRPGRSADCGGTLRRFRRTPPAPSGRRCSRGTWWEASPAGRGRRGLRAVSIPWDRVARTRCPEEEQEAPSRGDAGGCASVSPSAPRDPGASHAG